MKIVAYNLHANRMKGIFRDHLTRLSVTSDNMPDGVINEMMTVYASMETFVDLDHTYELSDNFRAVWGAMDR